MPTEIEKEVEMVEAACFSPVFTDADRLELLFLCFEKYSDGNRIPFFKLFAKLMNSKYVLISELAKKYLEKYPCEDLKTLIRQCDDPECDDEAVARSLLAFKAVKPSQAKPQHAVLATIIVATLRAEASEEAIARNLMSMFLDVDPLDLNLG